jgi:hypothetical protein
MSSYFSATKTCLVCRAPDSDVSADFGKSSSETWFVGEVLRGTAVIWPRLCTQESGHEDSLTMAYCIVGRRWYEQIGLLAAATDLQYGTPGICISHLALDPELCPMKLAYTQTLNCDVP